MISKTKGEPNSHGTNRLPGDRTVDFESTVTIDAKVNLALVKAHGRFKWIIKWAWKIVIQEKFIYLFLIHKANSERKESKKRWVQHSLREFHMKFTVVYFS